MVLPILPVIAAAATAAAAGTGVYKSHRAGAINAEAEELFLRAKRQYMTQLRQTDRSKQHCNSILNQYGQQKLRILSNQIYRFVLDFSKLKQIHFQRTPGLYEIPHLTEDDLKKLTIMSREARTLSSAAGAMRGSMAGGVTAVTVYGAAANFGIASTGAAISGLGGAAATNATLAFLGGGSLAAGGLGIAGGTAVLGGLTIGPAIAIYGIVKEARAQTNLEHIKADCARIEEACSQLKLVQDRCRQIQERTMLYGELLRRLIILFNPWVAWLHQTIIRSGIDYNSYTAREKQYLAMTVALAKAIKTVLDTPLLTPNGSLTQQSEQTAQDIQNEIRKGKFRKII